MWNVVIWNFELWIELKFTHLLSYDLLLGKKFCQFLSLGKLSNVVSTIQSWNLNWRLTAWKLLLALFVSWCEISLEKLKLFLFLLPTNCQTISTRQEKLWCLILNLHFDYSGEAFFTNFPDKSFEEKLLMTFLGCCKG